MHKSNLIARARVTKCLKYSLLHQPFPFTFTDKGKPISVEGRNCNTYSVQ